MNVRRIGKLCALLVAVFVFCWISVRYFRGETAIAAMWPANAVILAFVIGWSDDWKRRAGVVAAACGAMVLANLALGRDLVLSLGFPVANAVEILVAAAALRGVSLPLTGIKALGVFLAGPVIAAPAVAALVAVAVLRLSGSDTGLGGAFVRWAASDALGMIIIAPFAFSLSRLKAQLEATWQSLAYGLAAQFMVAATAYFVFFQAHVPFPVVILPLIMLAVYFNRDFGGALALAIVSVIALSATGLGRGGMFLVAASVGRDPILMTQATIAVLALTVHPVAAMMRKLDFLKAQVEERRDAAEAQSRNKTKLLAHVSHEIRTPLSGVVTLAEMMRQGALGQLTPRQLDMITRIAESGSEIEALSRDLLDAASIQAGKTTLSKETVEVSQALKTAVEAASFRLRDYDATVEMGEGVGAGLSVTADPMRLRQMLMNLIINAAKYGGRPPIVRIDAVADGAGAVRFTIDDNGPGIAPDRRDEIFNAFERSGAETSEVDGAGVGLALVRELAELQDGKVGVEDGALGGACFWVMMPRAQANAQAA
jgi:signal transduction histidine kinase